MQLKTRVTRSRHMDTCRGSSYCWKLLLSIVQRVGISLQLELQSGICRGYGPWLFFHCAKVSNNFCVDKFASAMCDTCWKFLLSSCRNSSYWFIPSLASYRLWSRMRSRCYPRMSRPPTLFLLDEYCRGSKALTIAVDWLYLNILASIRRGLWR